MSYFGGIALGVSPFYGLTGITLGDYTSFKIYGGQSYFDNTWLLNYTMTTTDVLNIPFNTEPIWDESTLLLATYNEEDFNAGNVQGLTTPITGFEIFRRKDTETSLTKLYDSGTTIISEYIDITAEPNTTYYYDIIPKNAIERGRALENSIITDFYNVYLIDPITYRTFIFNLNLEMSSLSAEVANQRYDGYNKYSAYSFGERNFLTGQISAVVQDGIICGTEPMQTVDFIKELQDFINNGQEKILKTRKGEVMKVVTPSYSHSPLDIRISQQPYVVNFSFEEVGEVI